ncbi:MAG: hypothetical protein NWF01_03905 [Candidatus Bathyarchaeota archaeon]|nr:hypothetical protein [Candidatus Bathyarchaeota archaeon]
MNMKSKALLILSLMAIATVATSMVFALDSTTQTDDTTTTPSGMPDFAPAMMDNSTMGMRMGPGCHGQGGPGQMEVSDEYTAKATDIASSDSEVIALLDQGYNITAVHPIITTVVDADGNVTLKATAADVVLQGTEGRVLVTVNIAEGTVTNITTLPAPPAQVSQP